MYIFNEGYWGPHIGYYGGVNYGFGYGGIGFAGGEWRGGVFAYNTAVMHVNTTVIHTTYVNETIVKQNTIVNTSHTAYSGGPGGVQHQPTPEEKTAMNETHVPPTKFQQQHAQTAAADKTSYAKNNNGHPQHLVAEKPLAEEKHAPPPAVAHNASSPASHPAPAAHPATAQHTAAPESHATPATHTAAPATHPAPATAHTPAPASQTKREPQPHAAPAARPAPAPRPAPAARPAPAPGLNRNPKAKAADPAAPQPEGPRSFRGPWRITRSLFSPDPAEPPANLPTRPSGANPPFRQPLISALFAGLAPAQSPAPKRLYPILPQSVYSF